MEIIFVLLAISICLAIFFLISFLWATKTGQFDDTEGPAMRMLFDSEIEKGSASTEEKTKKECK